MIQLTRLNRQPLTVNSELIKFIEQAHDTVITLATGEKIVVLENTGEVLERIIDFKRRVLSGMSGVWISPTVYKLHPDSDDKYED